MKKQYIRDLRDGDRVDSVFALRSRDVRSARTGETYLALEVSDRTGRISAVMFRPSASDESVPSGSVVRMRGTVTTYRGIRRISVDTLRPETTYERQDLLASGARPHDEILAELRSLVRRVKEPALRAVIGAVFGSPGFIDRFAACPATDGEHHAYVGGLIEHTVSVATACVSLAALYPTVDRDLLLAAALLHDVGRVEELAYDISVGLTESGRLIGHVVLGDRLVSAAMVGLGDRVPADLASRLSHALLAHHGETESPRRPCSLEALILNQVDALDARTTAFAEAVSGAAVLDESWTDAANGFARPLMVPRASVPAPELACA